MAVGDIYEFRAIVSTSSQIAVNVYHHRVYAETATPVALSAVAAAFDARVQQAYKDLMTSQATYRGVGVRKIWPLPPSLEVAEIANLGVGAGIGEPMPKQIAGLITFRTAFSGRRYRGRKYWPFPTEDHNGPNAQPIGLYTIGLQSIGDLLITDLGVTDGIQSATFRYGTWGRTTQTFTPFISAIARPSWATQRRRGDFGRQNTPPF